MTYLTRAQRESVYRLWCRSSQGMSYRAFRKTVHGCFDYVMVQWCNMYMGIELDGYTHS